jgi:hypothetical protein
LVDKGTWRAPSESEEKLIALQSEVERLKLRQKAKIADKPAMKWKAKGPLTGQNKANSKKNPKREKELWMLVAPTAREPRNKTVKGKEWHFCDHHKEWCCHKTQDCLKKGMSDNVGGDPRLVRALQATFEDGTENK